MTDMKFSFLVGFITLSYVENSLRNYCFHNGYDISIEKGTGFLSKPMWITITVPDNDVSKVKNDVYDMFDEVE